LQKIYKPHLKIIVTLGAKGAILFKDNQITDRINGLKVTPIDTTGAGDCFCGTLACFLSLDYDLLSALECANRAASISVTRAGAAPSMPTRKEIDG
jgi:ribokinase